MKAFVTYEAKKAAEERCKVAKEAKKEAHKKQYEGNAKAFLLARRVEKDEAGKLSFHDFKFSYLDENGMNVPEVG